MPVTLPTTADRVVAVARGELGQREVPAGSNRTRYGAAFGMDGQPWCAQFVWWVFRAAGAGDLRDALDTRSLAWTPAFAAACAKAGWQPVDVRQARAGDIAFFDFPDAVFRIQHIGIVERSTGSAVVCIEGNTSVTSQDNGGNVMRRTRPGRYVKVIYRPVYEEDDMPLTDADVNKVADAAAKRLLDLLAKPAGRDACEVIAGRVWSHILSGSGVPPQAAGTHLRVTREASEVAREHARAAAAHAQAAADATEVLRGGVRPIEG